MNAELRCDDLRPELSARLDGEVDGRTSALLDAHLETCAACRSYEASLRSIKRAVALQPADGMKDIAPRVVSRIEWEQTARRRERRSLLRTAVAAAAVTALVLSGAVLPRPARPDVAVASEITQAVQRAATSVSTYHAEFDITERGWNDSIPERHFTAEIWFSAPEHLRMEIRDLTPYPGEGWPSNNATLVATPESWWLRETASCPAEALPGCNVSPEPEVRALTNRQPFDGSTSLPTDLILPLETLADSEGLSVVGRETIGGRDAHHVVLRRWQAGPLLDSLRVAGTWRGFPPTAAVDLWLDAETWFPLRFEIHGGDGALEVTTTSFEQPDSLPDSTFTPPDSGDARDGGFRTADPGSRPLPEDLLGLEPYRSGVTGDGQTIDSFVDGMAWVKVVTDGAERPSLATFASELVELGPGSVAYYRPSGEPPRRTVEILARDRRVRLESNLPRRDLIEIAASVPVDGREVRSLRTQSGAIERVGADALSAFGYAGEPGYLPDGFRFSSAYVFRSSEGSEQLVGYYRRGESAPDPGDIRITQSPDVEILPPTSEALRTVTIDEGTTARWSPVRSELEWLEGTRYRSVAVPAFDLATAIRIARSMHP